MANLTPPALPSPTPTVSNNFQQTPTLTQIEQKVRRLTRSPSQNELASSDLYNYVNTFLVYDFPEHLRTYNLKVFFTFYTNPGQDSYSTDIASFGGATNAASNPLYNFQNLYISVHPPFYIGGYQTYYSQSPEQFFGIYPIVNSIASISQTGNGSQTQFSGMVNINGAVLNNNQTQNASLLQNQVLFSGVDVNGNGLAMIDSPIIDSNSGLPTQWGILYPPNNPPVALPLKLTAPYQSAAGFPSTNYINYFTGQFVVTFPVAPATGTTIYSQTVPSVSSIPQAVLFFQDQFIVRPVPDQAYRVQFEAFQRPTALLAQNQAPELEEYWQYIAYGCAKKIFEDRMDLDSVQMIMPEYKKQECLVLRRTLNQNKNERTATIYTEQVSFGSGFGGWGSGGGPF